jgi:hypothetical protein
LFFIGKPWVLGLFCGFKKRERADEKAALCGRFRALQPEKPRHEDLDADEDQDSAAAKKPSAVRCKKPSGKPRGKERLSHPRRGQVKLSTTSALTEKTSPFLLVSKRRSSLLEKRALRLGTSLFTAC